jgi:uncharacterized protein YjeT (DUF2065 family)
VDYFLCVAGLVLIIEGLPYFIFPEKMKQVLLKIPLVPASSLRAFGITAIMLGILLVFIARRLLE